MAAALNDRLNFERVNMMKTDTSLSFLQKTICKCTAVLLLIALLSSVGTLPVLGAENYASSEDSSLLTATREKFFYDQGIVLLGKEDLQNALWCFSQSCSYMDGEEMFLYTIARIYEQDGALQEGYKIYSELNVLDSQERAHALLLDDGSPDLSNGVRPTLLSMKKSSLTLDVGNSESIAVAVEPDETTCELAWVSSNPAVATVDQSGTVTGVESGTATIECTDEWGNRITCKVTVRAESADASTLTQTKKKKTKRRVF